MRSICLWTIFLVFSAPVWGQNRSGCKGPEELERAVSSRPSAAAYNALGAYFAGRKQFACAISAFEKALQIDSTSWETRYNLGLALIEKGDWERAALELRRVVVHKPDLLDARNALGSALEGLSRLEAAEEEFKAALRIDPRSVHALHGLGRVLMAQRRFNAAISYLTQAVEIEPKDVGLRVSLAAAYSQKGNPQPAIAFLKELAASHPQSAFVFF